MSPVGCGCDAPVLLYEGWNDCATPDVCGWAGPNLTTSATFHAGERALHFTDGARAIYERGDSGPLITETGQRVERVTVLSDCKHLEVTLETADGTVWPAPLYIDRKAPHPDGLDLRPLVARLEPAAPAAAIVRIVLESPEECRVDELRLLGVPSC